MKFRPLMLILLLAAGCSSKSKLDHQTAPVGSGLSSVELSAVAEVAKANPSTPVNLAIFDGKSLVSKSVPANEVAAFENATRKENPSLTIALDASVKVQKINDGADLPYAPNDQLLYAGKEAFGLTSFKKKFPNADGRGVKIAIVDDGVSLDRPGLIKTSTGAAKFARSIQASPLWQFPIFDGEAKGCQVSEPAKSTEAVAAWKFSAAVLKDRDFLKAKKKIVLDIDTCGINPDVKFKATNCPKWTKVGTVLAAMFVEFENETRILVDFNGDGEITDDEALEPISQNGFSYFRLEDGRAVGFDVHPFDKIVSAHYQEGKTSFLTGTDQERKDCASDEKPQRILTIALPESEEDFGSHGEGVAGVSSGYQIAGRDFDGMAPGAQIVDVHYSDAAAGRAYTVSEIARALRIGGLNAEIVNLSYSLFFNSPASQVAMGRLMEVMLKDTSALYFVSAGNNGPGRDSMNRALLYPEFSIPVAAYLDPKLSQTTFGSALPIGGVVTYSSRGPGLDGASGALALSPLAGIVPSTADGGFGPFSGTSSATPTLAGFTARVLSEVYSEGLKFDRDVLRKAVLLSAKKLDGVPFIDQGYGIPQLEKAVEVYRVEIAKTRNLPVLKVVGAVSGQGIEQKGISIRGNTGMASAFTFSITPKFSDLYSEKERADYAESLKFEHASDFVSVTTNLLLARQENSIQIVVDMDKLRSRGPGEYLDEIEIRNADTGELRAIIPVTVLLPVADFETFETVMTIPSKGLVRTFMKKPSWATNLLVSTRTTNGNVLCGSTKLFTPAGVNETYESSSGPNPVYRERSYRLYKEGVYELIVEGRMNHVACPQDQKVKVTAQWVGLRAESVSGGATFDAAKMSYAAKFGVQFTTEAQAISGKIRLTDVAVVRDFTMNPEGDGSYYADREFDFSVADKITFRVSDDYLNSKKNLMNYPLAAMYVLARDKAPVEFQMMMNGSSVKLPVIPFKNDYASASLGFMTFDYGVTSISDLVKTPIKMTMRQSTLDLMKIDLGGSQTLQLMNGDSAVLNYTYAVPAKMPKEAVKALCQFTPDGWSTAVSCGDVDLQ